MSVKFPLRHLRSVTTKKKKSKTKTEQKTPNFAGIEIQIPASII